VTDLQNVLASCNGGVRRANTQTGAHFGAPDPEKEPGMRKSRILETESKNLLEFEDF
jgi:hypothetical protein